MCFFQGVSSATGDLVDNHDIIQFNVRSLEGVEDPEADYEKWATAEQQVRNAIDCACTVSIL